MEAINWHYTDETRAVVAASFADGHHESHLVTSDCIQAWLAAGNTPLPYEPPTVDPKEQAKLDLANTDKEMARIAEDLINTLVSKGVIAIKDLPKPAADKLAERIELRKALK